MVTSPPKVWTRADISSNDARHRVRGPPKMREMRSSADGLGAATYARARSAEVTDWVRIAELYDILAQVTPSPVVEVNRAVAHGRAFGPEAGLAILKPVDDDPMMSDSHLLPSVRGDLLARAVQTQAAIAAFLDAASLTRNETERALLCERAQRLR
jgi:predicted RNA polymerase sigma factor